MNFDITVCTGKWCEKKELCYRFYAFKKLQDMPVGKEKPGDRRGCLRGQSMMEKQSADGKICDLYWGGVNYE
jgi:hypothetical protein